MSACGGACKVGEIAEERELADALEHYKRAYDLDATLEHQQAYARLCWQMGKVGRGGAAAQGYLGTGCGRTWKGGK